MRAVEAGPGTVHFDYGTFLSARKVATVFEDPSIQASDTKIYRGFTHELYIFGTGFNRVVQPILGFDPPLDTDSVNVHVSSIGRLQTLLLMLLLLFADSFQKIGRHATLENTAAFRVFGTTLLRHFRWATEYHDSLLLCIAVVRRMHDRLHILANRT